MYQCKCGRKMWAGPVGPKISGVIKYLAARRAVRYEVLCQPARLFLCAVLMGRKKDSALFDIQQRGSLYCACNRAPLRGIIECMSTCRHEILTLVPPPSAKLRCRHCHLTISESELDADCCPECLDAHKVRRRDFDKVIAAETHAARYRCESCGMIVESS